MTPRREVTPTRRLCRPEGGASTKDLVSGSFRPHVNLHTITQEALRQDFAFANSHPFRVINKIGDRKLIQPRDALFMLHLSVMIDLQQLIHAN